MIDINEVKTLTQQKFFISPQILQEHFPNEPIEEINRVIRVISRDNSFRELDNNNFTIYSKKEYRNIQNLVKARKHGSHVIIKGKKRNGDPYLRKCTIDGFAFPGTGDTLVRVQDELRSRYSSFVITQNLMDNVTIVPEKPFQK